MVRRLDAWFRSVQIQNAAQMQCGPGCAQCCHGLFDISLPDAVRIAGAFDMLQGGVQASVKDRSSAIQQRICRDAPELREPFFLNAMSHETIDCIADSLPNVRCPLLDDGNRCLVYEARPVACRLEGIPMVDCRDGLFGDWCELNFLEGVTPEQTKSLKLDYYEIQSVEQEAGKSILECLPENPKMEVTVFIPSIIASFATFWKELSTTIADGY